ncbi:MAG TPA: YCF48-related protein, partial [Vicinamibacteria bacterium]|nr:YCF48-related protein [Vicinamibacteria bacterium]
MRILALTSLALALTAPAVRAETGWSRQAPIPTGFDLYAVAHVSASDIWAAGGPGVLVHSTDAGQTWRTGQLATDSLHALFFLDAQHGWAAGNGLFHTSNGGETWIKDNSWGSIYDLFFLDTQRGWACGNGGVTYRTTNGGLSWSWTAVGTMDTLSSVWFVDALRGWTVDIAGRIYLSTDGGQSWTLQFQAPGGLSTLQFFDGQEGWAIGGNTFLHTVNGGQSWTQTSAVPQGTWSYAARFSDRLNGISVGEYGNVTRTTDGGQTWTTVAHIGTGPRLWDVESASTTSSIYVGDAGALARSTNGGADWKAI